MYFYYIFFSFLFLFNLDNNNFLLYDEVIDDYFQYSILLFKFLTLNTLIYHLSIISNKLLIIFIDMTLIANFHTNITI
jgi:hypothetical protein